MPRRWLPLVFFFLILLFGQLFGLTDDEAYYWVLAQNPALGYAYHPPAVAWSITVSQFLLGPIFGPNSVMVVRFPAAFFAASSLALGLAWLRSTGVLLTRFSGVLLLSFPGFFALSWMMVPDLPLFFGFTAALVGTFGLCFEERLSFPTKLLLFGGGLFLVLSKYSGLLAIASALLSILLFAPRPRLKAGFILVLSASILGFVPILYWNSTHEWASILYQIQERHAGGGGASGVRALRFWGAQGLLAGLPLIGFFFFSLFNFVRNPSRVAQPIKFLWVWILPAAIVFLIQPIFSDFKPHWALIVWWPTLLAFVYCYHHNFQAGLIRRLAFFQTGQAVVVSAFVLVSCVVPLGGVLMQALSRNPDPRLDVTNDLYGWSKLPAFFDDQVNGKLDPASSHWPVLASRYQTASQASFALQGRNVVSWIPRETRARDEWRPLSVSDGVGPAWPRLIKPVLYISDNRYDAPPMFPNARCEKFWKLQGSRWNYPAKQIDIWKCLLR
ncbi:hypothetical protein WDW86_07015 [Bdellovibrionota bacterium FG-2]